MKSRPAAPLAPLALLPEYPRRADAYAAAGGGMASDTLQRARRLFSMKTAPLLFLVVEDNETFLHILCEMLHALGHRTERALSAEDALDLMKQQRFDALLADITLPGMSGIDLAKQVVKAVPGIRVIFSSGYGYLLSDALDFEFDLLHKPYFLNQLEQVIG